MAITQVGSATSTDSASSNSTSVTVSRPTGVTTGDVLIALFSHNDQTGSASGWTRVDGSKTPGEAFRCDLAYKVVTNIGTEPSTYDFTVPSADGPLVASITAWRGVDNANPVNIDAVTPVDNAGTAPTSPSITTTTALTRVFYARHARRPGATSSGTTTPTFSVAAGGVSELLDTFAFSGGSTKYAHALYVKDAEETTTGLKSGVAIASSQDANIIGNLIRTFALKSAAVPATGTLTSSVPLISSAFAATRTMAEGPLDVQVPSITSAFEGAAAPPSGTVDTVLPSISSDFTGGQYHGPISSTLASITSTWAGAVNPIGSFSGQLGAVTSEFTAESRKFGEHVINVEPEYRAFLVTDEGTGLVPIKRSQVTDA